MIEKGGPRSLYNWLQQLGWKLSHFFHLCGPRSRWKVDHDAYSDPNYPRYLHIYPKERKDLELPVPCRKTKHEVLPYFGRLTLKISPMQISLPLIKLVATF